MARLGCIRSSKSKIKHRVHVISLHFCVTCPIPLLALKDVSVGKSVKETCYTISESANFR